MFMVLSIHRLGGVGHGFSCIILLLLQVKNDMFGWTLSKNYCAVLAMRGWQASVKCDSATTDLVGSVVILAEACENHLTFNSHPSLPDPSLGSRGGAGRHWPRVTFTAGWLKHAETTWTVWRNIAATCALSCGTNYWADNERSYLESALRKVTELMELEEDEISFKITKR